MDAMQNNWKKAGYHRVDIDAMKIFGAPIILKDRIDTGVGTAKVPTTMCDLNDREALEDDTTQIAEANSNTTSAFSQSVSAQSIKPSTNTNMNIITSNANNRATFLGEPRSHPDANWIMDNGSGANNSTLPKHAAGISHGAIHISNLSGHPHSHHPHKNGTKGYGGPPTPSKNPYAPIQNSVSGVKNAANFSHPSSATATILRELSQAVSSVNDTEPELLYRSNNAHPDDLVIPGSADYSSKYLTALFSEDIRQLIAEHQEIHDEQQKAQAQSQIVEKRQTLKSGPSVKAKTVHKNSNALNANSTTGKDSKLDAVKESVKKEKGKGAKDTLISNPNAAAFAFGGAPPITKGKGHGKAVKKWHRNWE